MDRQRSSRRHGKEKPRPQVWGRGFCRLDAGRYYWKNGEGIVFDDNYLHDAANDSDEVRVILWLDLRRKMPFYLQWFNRLCLAVVHREKSVRRIRENASIIGDVR